jgi:hypothetical protein
LYPNANLVGSDTWIANLDSVATTGQINAGLIAYRDIVAARCVLERTSTDGRVTVTALVASKRTLADGRVAIAAYVASERIRTDGRSHDAVIRVYDEAGNVIETHEHEGEFNEW